MDNCWRKSSYSNPAGECLEARWAKSSHSMAGNGDSPQAWAAFISGIKG